MADSSDQRDASCNEFDGVPAVEMDAAAEAAGALLEQASEFDTDPLGLPQRSGDGSKVVFWLIVIVFGAVALFGTLWYINRGKRQRPAPLADPNGQTVDLSECFKSAEAKTDAGSAPNNEASDEQQEKRQLWGLVFPSPPFLKAVRQRAVDQQVWIAYNCVPFLWDGAHRSDSCFFIGPLQADLAAGGSVLADFGSELLFMRLMCRFTVWCCSRPYLVRCGRMNQRSGGKKFLKCLWTAFS